LDQPKAAKAWTPAQIGVNERAKTSTLSEAIPVIWCLKRIRHGAAESVAAKYEKVVANN
jgi:hypothetical protein